MRESGRTVLVMAYTVGTAAYNVNGFTIHSGLGIQAIKSLSNYYPLSPQQLDNYRKGIKHVGLVLIDEISLLGAYMLYGISRRLGEIMGKNNVPFGGLHVLFVGDLFQLGPVTTTQIFKFCSDKYVTNLNTLGPNLWRMS